MKEVCGRRHEVQGRVLSSGIGSIPISPNGSFESQHKTPDTVVVPMASISWRSSTGSDPNDPAQATGEREKTTTRFLGRGSVSVAYEPMPRG